MYIARMKVMYRWCFLMVFLACVLGIQAQSAFVYVDSISLTGNQRTRSEVVFRELKFKKGDSIAITTLEETLEESEQLVMNTGLFNQAHISFKNWEGATNKVHIQVDVAETWFIYPVPVLELVDRNFNVWWKEQNRSLDRLNIGIEFTHLNFTGRRDRLQLTAKYGYTRSYSIKYSLPFFNRHQTLGLDAEVSFARNRELNYLTEGNKQAFYKSTENDFLYQRFRTETSLIYRPGYHLFHSLRLRFEQNAVDEIVALELNPDFYLKGEKLQRSFTLEYSFAYDRRDVRAYPLSGMLFSADVTKTGLGIFGVRNGLTLQANYDLYFPLSRRWSAGARMAGKLSLIRSLQPYNDYRAIGFGKNNLYGYELYIIDGLDMALAKPFIRYQLFERVWNFGKIMPLKAFRSMPLKAFLSINNGLGYANNPFTSQDNSFSNRMLWGGGVGLDIVLFYDKVIQIQYSFNHLFEKGLFLHVNMNI
ncbi:MAG: BamA/TamA family outer membrane protein [Saprospiraceae bacterium]